jgi:peptidyl-prolyl cis-trans isomerase SurA
MHRRALHVFAVLLLAMASLPANAQLAEGDPADEVQGGFFAPGTGGFGSFGDEGDAEAALPSETEVLVEGIAAQVGNGVVLVSEVRRLAAPIEVRMRKGGVPEGEIRAMRAEALERLIEQRLIEDIVRRAQLSATEAEVDQAVAAIAQENGLTLEQMRQSIAGHGLTLEEYRAKIKGEIERNKVLGSMVRSRVQIDDRELRDLYDQKYGGQRKSGAELHLRHLLVAVAAERMRDQDTACRIAADIRAEVVAGTISFADAASRFSDTNAERGGDLGWVHAEELAGWMGPSVARLEPGQISDVIPMSFGCNLLEVVDRREFTPVSFEDAQESLYQALFTRKMEEEYVLWIEKLRTQVYIERRGIYAEATRVGNRTTR